MKKFLAIAAAGGALAIGVPAALAATDAPDRPSTTPVQNATPTPDSQQEQQRPDRGDCPEKDGRGGGNDNSSTANEI
jgi:hypothetical protein